MGRSGDERGERLRTRLESEQSRWPKATLWVVRQWWIYIVTSGALALSALSDLADDPTAEARTDALIALAVSGLLLVVGVVGFVNRRKRIEAKAVERERREPTA